LGERLNIDGGEDDLVHRAVRRAVFTMVLFWRIARERVVDGKG